MRTRVKVCCIDSREEAAMAIDAGADLLGLVGPMPSGPGPIPLELAAESAQAVPPGFASVLLTSATELAALVEEIELVRPTVLQLTDAVRPAVLEGLRDQAPGTRLIQVLHVEDRGVVETASALAPVVDGLLLDSGRPGAAVKELGGTGRVHDWRLSRQVVEAVNQPVFLAGGLGPQNIGSAIGAVRPFGVDLCSGIRTDGRLDAALLDAFMCGVRAADNQERSE